MKKQVLGLLAASLAIMLVCTSCGESSTVSMESSSASSRASSSISSSAGSEKLNYQNAGSTSSIRSTSTSIADSSSKPVTNSLPNFSASSIAQPVSPKAEENLPTQANQPAPSTREPEAQPVPAPVPQPAPTPAPVPTPSPPPTPTPQPSPEPAFDVNQYVSYGISYGQGIGLAADAGTTGSWDNPIIAGPGITTLERDIAGLLDWYKSSGMTHFWVWATPRGDGKYDLYIGYA